MSPLLGKLVILVLLLPACSGPRQPELELSGDPVELPPACGIERVAGTVDAYLVRYSSGQPVPLEEHFAPVANDRPRPHYYSHGFQWFADNGGTDPDGFQAYWPGRKLAAYIERQQEADDHQELAELYVNSYSPDQDWALFGIMIRRSRTNVASNLTLGKGAVRCRDQRITLWNLGPLGGGDGRPPLCDGDETAGDDAVVCSR